MFLMLCSRETCLLALHLSLHLFRSYDISCMKIKNNSDKFLSQKSMRAADEKLIINKLRAYMAIRSSQAGQVSA